MERIAVRRFDALDVDLIGNDHDWVELLKAENMAWK
jgi:hypothetical protein